MTAELRNVHATERHNLLVIKKKLLLQKSYQRESDTQSLKQGWERLNKYWS
jgi:hypothetical protein